MAIQLQFDSYGDMLKGVASATVSIDDVAKFADPMFLCLCLGRSVKSFAFPSTCAAKLIQRVSFLGALTGGVSSELPVRMVERFVTMVQTAPGCCGYNQNLVIVSHR